jgi:hypothetical protein
MMDSVTSAPSPVTAARSPVRTLAEAGAAGAVFFVLACLLYWPTALLGSGRLPGCACGDPEQQTWFLAWMSHALTHGLNPFFTDYLNAPRGANLAIDTAMPLLGVLGMPLTLLAGPAATFNLLLRLGLAASGASMFGVLRRYTSWWPAAFGGGLLFAFSPYLAGQAVRHVFLSFVPLVPLFIPLLDDWLVSRSRPPFRSGMLLGLVAALQYLISPEILLTSALMAGAGLGWLAIRNPRAVPGRAAVLARGLVTAVPVFLLIAGYAVWLLIAGPRRPAVPVHILSGGLSRYHADLLSPLLPTSRQLFAPGALAAAGDRLPAGGTIENGFYLGLPLLALLCFFVVRYRRVPLVVTAAVIGLAAFVLGLGSRLTVDGRASGVRLPFTAFTHLPILQNLEPARLSLYVQLAAAVILAVGLDRARAAGTTAPGWVWPALVAAAGLAVLLPLVPGVPIRTYPVRIPGFFTSREVRQVPPGALALTFPYELAPRNDGMMWQIASGMRFRLLGGDVFVPGPRERTTWHPVPQGPPVLRAVLEAGQYPGTPPPPVTAAAAAAIRDLCARAGVSVVLVDRKTPYGRAFDRLVHQALRVPGRVEGQMSVWLNVQRDLHGHPR